MVDQVLHVFDVKRDKVTIREYLPVDKDINLDDFFVKVCAFNNDIVDAGICQDIEDIKQKGINKVELD